MPDDNLCEYATYSEEDEDFHKCTEEATYFGSRGEADNIENYLSSGNNDWEVWFSSEDSFQLCDAHKTAMQDTLNKWRNSYNYEADKDPF